jgi:hypothetical protein
MHDDRNRSPAFSARGRRPVRNSSNGAPISTLHSAAPSPAGTSTWIQQCGLVHWNSFTVPLSVTDFLSSNIAPE